ncbi:MAG TPA: DUF72 domain-containing protein [Rudaea sp.]|nr:DUF72 domain-containing protein [Rudaea sp.]
MSARIRIGISGWLYGSWRGVFYPSGLVQRRELEFASRRFASIEINGSFYSLQHPDSWERWHAETPAGFVFAVKCPRYISHLRRLKDVEAPLANFFASGVLLLGRKLGPLLWQFPPHLRFDAARWERFLGLLPRSMAEAAACARGHDKRLRHAAIPERLPKRRLRYAVEIRHESFCCEEFVALLRHHNVALVVADTARKFPYLEDVTADFVYLRLHGAEELYTSGYDDDALRMWKRRIECWAAGGEPRNAQRAAPARPARRRAHRDVYCYFDNDAKVHAPFDAQRLSAMLGLASNDMPYEERGRS